MPKKSTLEFPLTIPNLASRTRGRYMTMPNFSGTLKPKHHGDQNLRLGSDIYRFTQYYHERGRWFAQAEKDEKQAWENIDTLWDAMEEFAKIRIQGILGTDRVRVDLKRRDAYELRPPTSSHNPWTQDYWVIEEVWRMMTGLDRMKVSEQVDMLDPPVYPQVNPKYSTKCVYGKGPGEVAGTLESEVPEPEAPEDGSPAGGIDTTATDT
ncbi:MAG: hypothetical protein Q9227_008270 [Pyrenula ochraceoflavens]